MRRTILITGASSGLGAEMARQFAATGRDLALVARREDRLVALRDELVSAHPGLRVVLRVLDVTDQEQVFETFRAVDAELGGLDRVIVNAGRGQGARLGTGGYDANRQTALTNFVGALAQVEAAMELFRARDAGHLVLMSSMAGVRGLPKGMATYAATKAAVATLGEGLRVELLKSPITVTTIRAGYIRSELNEFAPSTPFLVDTAPGVREIVAAIEAERAVAYVPRWPWAALRWVLTAAPLPLLRRLAG